MSPQALRATQAQRATPHENPFGFPASVDPYEATTSAPPAQPRLSGARTPFKRTTARARKGELKDKPRWFADERKQQIAEFLAFNCRLDQMLGRKPSHRRWPYNQYRPAAVKAFFARCAVAPLNE